MSTAYSVFQIAVAPAQDISITTWFQVAAGVFASAALLASFKPLLIGVVRALMLVVRPKLSKEECLARRQMGDARMLSNMLNAMDAPSHAAELRALAARA